MRITVLAIGTRGDVQPYLALGVGLQAAGHRVQFAAFNDFERMVRSRGLDFIPVRVNLRTIFENDNSRAFLTTDHKVGRFTLNLKRIVEPIVEQLLVDFCLACQDAQAIIYSVLAFPAYFIARDLGIPSYAGCLQPLYRTRVFPSVMVPSWLGVCGQVNWLTHIMVEQVFWQFLRPFVKRWRKRSGLSPAPFWGHFRCLYRQHSPILCGYSPVVLPKPYDWGEEVHVTGYWFLDRPADWRPSAELVDFLNSGPPPVCIGFGSMDDGRMAILTELVLSALRRTGQRGILLTGWSGVTSTGLPSSPEVFATEEVPHDWLFPQVSAVIHHGGAGTTAAALRAGVPSIVIPFFFDQSFWGQRVVTLGVGPRPLSRNVLSAESLACAIQVAIGQEMHRRAVVLSQRIQSEDGVGRAVHVFHHHLGVQLV